MNDPARFREPGRGSSAPNFCSGVDLMGDSGVRNARELTPARLEWLQAIARGEVEATRVAVDNCGRPGWLPCCGTRMTDWMTDPVIYLQIWTPSVHIAPTGQRHPVFLTSEGRELLERWLKISRLRKGQG
jgi:hypothetical protein